MLSKHHYCHCDEPKPRAKRRRLKGTWQSDTKLLLVACILKNDWQDNV